MRKLGKQIRIWLLLNTRLHFTKVGRDFYCGRNLQVRPHCVSVGDHVYIGNYCHIASNTTIGNFVMLASYVSIVGGDHRIDLLGMPMIFAGRDVNRPVLIEDDSWIGHGAILIHGVTIGEGAIVAAGAVVAHDVAPYTIVAGVPAQFIRQRFTPHEQQIHSAMLKSYRKTRLIDPAWKKVGESG